MSAAEALHALRSQAEALGCSLIPLGPRYDERAPADLRIAALVPWAKGAFLLVSGGADFFRRFEAHGGSATEDPLDDYTREQVGKLVEKLRSAGLRAEARHPFGDGGVYLPFQKIGRAAGLSPSLLGLDLHPDYGPWFAYRALIFVDREIGDRDPVASPCPSCPAPCISACPASAVSREGWDVERCMGHRLGEDGCTDGCHSRLACPVGAAHRYPIDVLRYHQAAALRCGKDSPPSPPGQV